MKNKYLLVCIATLLLGCGNAKKQAEKNIQAKKTISVPTFSADSAYQYVKTQVDFGARVPNTKAHIACGNYLEAKLHQFGAKVIIQQADLMAFDGTILKAKNIIGSYNLDVKTRVLLFAHWDSRPWADNDPDSKNHKTPVIGANDGASGIGVLLEIARNLGKQNPNIGVDIAFFDAEDYGTTSGNEDSWCLGTQYWAKNVHVPGYNAKYGILLDMVGAPQATFYREQFSDYYAQEIVDKIWTQAASLGFSQYFINEQGGAITDDHIFVNKLAGIPSIDIIQYDKKSGTGFGSYWHTIHDTMDNVDATTLQAVGMTLMNVIYNE
ncbi:MAG: M28 family peptidase [Paludibacteraceae bacterium]